ncbi:glycerol dehydrogenase [Tetragenococcus koreensis]|uniref:Glycerol dehydrogenase n=2 Tax=Tetragenococcus TaxID=51668 RepID=A0AAN4UDD1_9ENTE|nr:glycerol dehydrogenase [Tetragenococcus koreensis]MDN5831336.1 glycerol dehydrogenase [Tetragenococcus halophilus]MCF1586128.1 glycerol dehydrogenase [Tetragenococcus koreensis]MCF1614251.1 glycerol dehydrogenase [Tetragenococcus koreensis]MCF1614257.1 glycerol dehydrogenase [Tetragenococcus koreensis]MCF1618272.1 glycerol dehydrogenase [Tetragenococcus koreensis]
MRKALVLPTKYVQGENELNNLGYFVSSFGKNALLIGKSEDIERVRTKLDQTAEKFGVELFEGGFNGEATRNEVKRLQSVLKERPADCVVGLGGGKALDTAKVVADSEGLEVVIAPTIAAQDAPTSHSAVLYTEEHNFDDYYYCKKSPGVVLADTTVIAQAPTRFLLAGMGDAMSTYFEARATHNSYSQVNASLPMGTREGYTPPARGTYAALNLAKLCFENLLEDGLKAKLSADTNLVTESLNKIVETNILLSGLGFESGGLAAAHAIYNGMTVLPGTHDYLHGEQVAFTTLIQLVLEDAAKEEINTVLHFYDSVGLPMTLEDIGVNEITYDQALEVAQKACIPEESIHSMPFPITEDQVANAIIVADQVGEEYKKNGQL